MKLRKAAITTFQVQVQERRSGKVLKTRGFSVHDTNLDELFRVLMAAVAAQESKAGGR